MTQWSAVQTYQTWFYRVGLVGIILLGAFAGIAAFRNHDNVSEVSAALEASTTSTIVNAPPLSTPPGADAPFSLSSPTDGSHWTVPLVTFVGVGPPGGTISIGGGPGVVITPTGTFAVAGLLGPGLNTVSVVVTAPNGGQSTLVVNVYYDLPAPTTKPRDTIPPKTPTTHEKTTTTHGGGGGGGGGGSTSTTSGGGGGTSTTRPETTTTSEEG